MGKPQNLNAAEREALARAAADGEAAAAAAAEQARVDAELRDLAEAQAADAERIAREAEEHIAEQARLEAERVLREEEDRARREAEKPRDGYAFLLAPEDVTGAGAGDQSYQVRDDGLIEVRAEHVAELLNHGFEPYE